MEGSDAASHSLSGNLLTLQPASEASSMVDDELDAAVKSKDDESRNILDFPDQKSTAQLDEPQVNFGTDGAQVEVDGPGGCPELEISFELGLQDSEALFSLNEELEKILDPKNTLRTPPPSIDLSPLECHALQQEETETLRAIYEEDMSPLNDNCTCFLVRIRFLSDEIKEEDVIKIWFSLPPTYPCVPPVFEIEANQSGDFSYRDADELFDLLMMEAINRVGGMMVFDLVTIAQDFMPELVERKKEQAARQAALDLERKQTMELEEAFTSRGVPREVWDVNLHDDDKSGEKAEGEGEGGSTGDELADLQDDLQGTYARPVHAPYGKPVHRAFSRPVHFIGPISDVIEKLPKGLQIARIENILRQDLAERFTQCWETAVHTLWQKERDLPKMYNLKPQIAFHGTLRRSLPSIVFHGLVIPGTRSNVKVRMGSSYGVGIYLSPNADTSLCYSDTERLIVCAALLGRVFKGAYDDSKFFRTERIHTFISPCGNEWVFFNAAQVLPCYVIQVYRAPHKMKDKVSHPPPLASLQENTDLHPDTSLNQDKLRERERKAKLLARARKFLPYGFGPGSQTVIEDAASFDDDEEDYGDFQTLRYAAMEAEDAVSSGIKVEQSELQKYRFKDSSKTVSIKEES